MPTPEIFLEATRWMGIATLALAAIATLAFLFKWGIRFRLVGISGFCAVLTVGLFGLSFQPFTATVVSGAIPYATVFDSGSTQIVIKVPPSITEPELRATLQQAAKNLLKPSRLGMLNQTPTIRARTIVHRDAGVSELLYLGQVQPIPDESSDLPITLKINAQQLAAAQASFAS
jgi:hypothetical protein